MELKCLIVTKEIYKERVLMEYIITDLMSATLLTQRLAPKIFIKHVKSMLISVLKH